MSTGINHTAPGTPAVSDEIFQWPIARMDNVYVWMTLFEEYLTSPLDKKNMYLASPQFFGPFLVEEKCSFFLGEVLHILHKNNYLDLTNTEFLEFRTLSNLCKMSIDKCLQMDNPCFQNLDGIDHDHGRNQGSDYGGNDLQNPQLYTCRMSSLLTRERRVQERIQVYALMIRNGTIAPPQGALPFPYSILTFVETENTAALRQSEQDIRLVLSTLGTKIHHFIYHLHHLSDSPFSIVELLCQFIRMMPNLQTLLIENDCPVDHWDKPDVPRGASPPFPNLDHLEVLKAKNAPIKILKPLIDKYGPHLKKISVYQQKNNFKYDGIFSPAVNLMELSLPRISTESGICQYLRDNIKQWSRTLRCISITIGIPQVLASRSGIFQELTFALREIFETGKLHTLNLFMDGWYINDNFYASDIRLKIPTLRRLWIHCLRFKISSIDFILGVSDSLEELVLIMGYHRPADKSQSEIIQFSGCWKKMEESNVWKLMPKLQKITIRYQVFLQRFYREHISIRPSNIS